MSSKPTPSPGSIHLILFRRENEDPFCLEIPTHIIITACKSPRKYLRYLGWCVLGVEGTLIDGQGKEVPLSGAPTDQGIYQYLVPGENPLAHAVDLEVIKEKTQVSSETTGSSELFSSDLLLRDGICVFSGLPGVGMHIIPYRTGDEGCSHYSGLWLQLIIHNRPHSKNLDSLTINDTRNVIYGAKSLREAYFDPRQVAVLKTPNPILEMTNISDRYIRRVIGPGLTFPDNSRYTLQWLVTPPETSLCVFPNNNDATFQDQTLPKPSDLLLHYNYGAAAVKQWGKNVSVLTDRPGIPRPLEPVAPSMEPEKNARDHSNSIKKKAAAMTIQERQGSSKKKKAHVGACGADSEVRHGWDEDDVMLFFWGNSKLARERRAREEQGPRRGVEEWRTAIPGV